MCAALIHLQDTSTYATITDDAAAEICDDLYRKIITWIVKGRKKKTISDDEIKYIRKTVNTTVKILTDISTYSTKLKKKHRKLEALSAAGHWH